MSKAVKTFSEGDLVFAKVKGYPPWPAKVISISGKDRYAVLFFGTSESANCKSQDIYEYEAFKEKYKANSKPAFQKALHEIEAETKAGAKRGRGKDKGDAHEQPDDKSEVSDESGKGDSASEKSATDSKQQKKKPPPRKPATKRQPAKRPSAASCKPETSDDDDTPLVQKKASKQVKPVVPKRGKAVSKSSAAAKKEVRPAAASARASARRRRKVSYKDDTSEEEAAASKPKRGKRHLSESSASSSHSAEVGTDEKHNARGGSAQSEHDSDADTKSGKSSVLKEGSRSPESKRSSSSGSKDSASSSSNIQHDSRSSSGDSDSASEKEDDAKKDVKKTKDSPKEHSESVTRDQSAELTKGSQNAEEDLPELSKQLQEKIERYESRGSSDQDVKAPKEKINRLPDRKGKGSKETSATNSSVEDDEIVVQRAHKATSRHTVLSESEDGGEEEGEKEEKDLEQMLREKEKEHRELKLKRSKEKMEERRKKQLQKQQELDEKERQRDEKKKQQLQKAKIEKKIVELDEVIKRSLAVTTKEIPKCLEAMSELEVLEVEASMLVKYPAIIDTLKKCRKYKADAKVASAADKLCAKFRMIASSDKSAFEALNKQRKSDKAVKKPATADVTTENISDSTAGENVEKNSAERKCIEGHLEREAAERSAAVNNNTAVNNTNIIDHSTAVKNTSAVQALHSPTAVPDQQQQPTKAPDVSALVNSSINTSSDRHHSDVEPIHTKDARLETTPNSRSIPAVDKAALSTSKEPPAPTVEHSVSSMDLNTPLVGDELPSEDALQARIRAIIEKSQQSAATIEEVLKKRKSEKWQSPGRKKRPHQDPEPKKEPVPAKVFKPSSVIKVKARKEVKGELDDAEIHDLLGI